MATKIKIKNSVQAGKAPTAADLERAELAINLADKKIYTKDANDAIIELGGGINIYNTAAALRAADPTKVKDGMAMTLGANAKGDGGGGTWIWNAGDTTADNLGTVLADAGSTGRWKRQDAEVSDVIWFGADNTGVADSAAAFNAAAQWAFTARKKLVGAGKFLINSTVEIFTDVDLLNTDINAADSNPAIKVRAHPTEPKPRLVDSYIGIGSLRSISTGPATTARGTGLELHNVNSCTIEVQTVSGFGTGIFLHGDNSGASYNTFIRPVAKENVVNLLFDATGTGYTNENVVLGGQCRHSSSMTAVPGTIGIHLPKATVNGNNNNRFIGVSLEGGVSENTIYLEGIGCVFEYCRFENAKQITLDGAQFNRFVGGYSPPFIGGGINVVEKNTPTNNIFDSQGVGPLVSYARQKGAGPLNSAAPYLLNAYSSGDILELRRFTTFKSIADITTDNWVHKFTGNGYSVKLDSRLKEQIELNITSTSRPKIKFTDAVNASDAFIGRYGANTLEAGGSIFPDTNGTRDLGSSSRQYQNIRATNGNIVTSDERLKQDIAPLDDAEKRVAVKLKGMMKKFRFKDAVKEKGDDARIHIGVIAQEVEQAFKDEGLDAHRYGLFCYDKWEQEVDEDGTVTQEAGEQYSMRYDELLAFIISAI